MIAVDTAESSKEVLPVSVVSSFNSRCDVSPEHEQLLAFYLVPSWSALDLGMHLSSLVTQLCPTLSNPVDSRPHQIQAFLDRGGSWEFGGKKSCAIKCFLWGALR